MTPYLTLDEMAVSTLEEQRSKFVSVLIHVESEDNVRKQLNRIKKEYPKATHYCYGYRLLDGTSRSSDAGEPSGTAGMPIYMTLERHNLKNVLLVVIRYFGGTLLGAGGLTRTYRKSAEQVILSAKLKEMKPLPHFYVRVPLKDFSLVESRLAAWGATLVERLISDHVSFEGYASRSLIHDLINLGLGQWEVTDLGCRWVGVSLGTTSHINSR